MKVYSYLSTGDSYNTLAATFHLGVSTVHYIIKDTCLAIWNELKDEFMPIPKMQDWRKIESEFWTWWNFPNCIGAIDGKHIMLQAPARSGSVFYNYKGTFSIVLMAIVDAQYRFTFIDVGACGSNAAFGLALINGELDIPPPKSLPNWPAGGVLPHCFVADEVFPLRADIMHPYPRASRQHRLSEAEQMFNYRLSHARRIVKNAFGTLAQRFCIFNRRIPLKPKNADKVVKACCVLHNYLMENKDIPTIYNRLNPDQEPYLQDDGAIHAFEHLHGYRSADEVRALCNLFKTYFQ